MKISYVCYSEKGLLIVHYLFAVFLSLAVWSVHSHASTQDQQIMAEKKIDNYDKAKQNTGFIKQISDTTTRYSSIPASSSSTPTFEFDGKARDEVGTEFWPPLFGYRLKVTDTFLVFFTCLLFVATLYLYRATRDLVKGADKTAGRQLRAYVFVKKINTSIVNNPDIGLVDNWRITVELGNGGNTPTKNLLVHTNWDSFPEKPMPDDFSFPDRAYGNPAPGLIGPGATLHTPHIDIPTALIDFVARKFQHVYIWGWADYDVVVGGGRHRTEFCFEILKDGDLMSFRPHGKFNGSDEECYREPSAYKK